MAWLALFAICLITFSAATGTSNVLSCSSHGRATDADDASRHNNNHEIIPTLATNTVNVLLSGVGTAAVPSKHRILATNDVGATNIRAVL